MYVCIVLLWNACYDVNESRPAKKVSVELWPCATPTIFLCHTYPLARAHTMSGLSAVVLDCGSYSTKAGLSGDDAPRVVFRSLVAHHRHGGPTVTGNEALGLHITHDIKHPIDHGMITNWADTELIWKRTHNSQSAPRSMLCCSPSLLLVPRPTEVCCIDAISSILAS